MTHTPTHNPNNESRSALAELEALLAAETETYQHVMSVMKNKTQILASGQFHALANCDQQLVALSQKSLNLEQSRLNLMTQFGDADMTLQQVVSQMQNRDDSKRLQDARAQLSGVLDGIRLLNQDHKRMLQQSTKWVSETMKVINSASRPEPVSYQATNGKVSMNKPHATKPAQSTVIRDA